METNFFLEFGLLVENLLVNVDLGTWGAPERMVSDAAIAEK